MKQEIFRCQHGKLFKYSCSSSRIFSLIYLFNPKMGFYSTEICVTLGLNSGAKYATLSINTISIFTSLLCTALIERTGRRKLLLAGFIGMSATSFLIAFIPFLIVSRLICLCIGFETSIFALISLNRRFGWSTHRYYRSLLSWHFTLSVQVPPIDPYFEYSSFVTFLIDKGPIAMLLPSEMFDVSARGKAMSVSIFLYWSSMVVITIAVHFLQVSSLEGFLWTFF